MTLRFRPLELGPSWREQAAGELLSSCQFKWAPEYRREARFMAEQAASRALSTLTREGTVPLEDATSDVWIVMRHVDPDSIVERGDRRYGSGNIAEWLRRNPGLDTVPIICSLSRNGYRVLDGHHRLRAYRLAGRHVPAFVIMTTPGSGQVIVG